MGNERRISTITDILIPKSLLKTLTPDLSGQIYQNDLEQSTAEEALVQQAIDAHHSQLRNRNVDRTLSISIARPEPAMIEDRGHKLRANQSTTTIAASSGHGIQLQTPTRFNINPVADDPLILDTNLFNVLSSYSLSDNVSSGFPNTYINKDLQAQNALHPRWSASFAVPPPDARCERDRGFTLPSKRSSAHRLSQTIRKSSVYAIYEKAKIRSAQIQRAKWAQLLFEYIFYLFLLTFIYFILIGLPLWNGLIYWMYWLAKNKFNFTAGFTITLGIAFMLVSYL